MDDPQFLIDQLKKSTAAMRVATHEAEIGSSNPATYALDEEDQCWRCLSCSGVLTEADLVLVGWDKETPLFAHLVQTADGMKNCGPVWPDSPLTDLVLTTIP